MSQGWTLEMRDGVALLTLDLGRANAMNDAFFDALTEGLAEAAEQRPAGLVLTGADSAFCAGLDLVSLHTLDRDAMAAFMVRFRDGMLGLLEFPARTVAAINGHAIAGGAVLAAACDRRLTVVGSHRIGVRETALGVGLPRSAMEVLRRALPPGRLEEVVLFGRLYDPEAALEIGLVDEVVRPERLLEAAALRARRDAEVPRSALAQVRRGLVAPWAEAIRQGGDDADWLDTWFSEEARQRIAAAIEALGR